MTPPTTQSLLINGFGVLFVILNSFGLGLRLPIGKLLAQFVTHRKIAVWALVINFVIIPLVGLVVATIAIALVSLLLLWRVKKLPEPVLILVAAGVGVAWKAVYG